MADEAASGGSAGCAYLALGVTCVLIGLVGGRLASPPWDRVETVKRYYQGGALRNGELQVKKVEHTDAGYVVELFAQCADRRLEYSSVGARLVPKDTLVLELPWYEGWGHRLARQATALTVLVFGGGAVSLATSGRATYQAIRAGGVAVGFTRAAGIFRNRTIVVGAALAAIAVAPVVAGAMTTYDGRPDCDAEHVGRLFRDTTFWRLIAEREIETFARHRLLTTPSGQRCRLQDSRREWAAPELRTCMAGSRA